MIDIDKQNLHYAIEDFFVEFLRGLSREQKHNTAKLLAHEFTIIMAKAGELDPSELFEITSQVMDKCLDASEEYRGEHGDIYHLRARIAKCGPKVIAENIVGGGTQQAQAERRLFDAVNHYNSEMDYRRKKYRG